ncbi:DNA-binding transcriptional activator MhpR [Advenella kashmirensis WT001]|uniref:DNA-binding transcriptional activator MhpR n=1 Tax=Advenella kashmirensis (strain DSM 17095 / LMG 22695 / WT001) TaxID=1036672 RepID=I3UDY3_ADVKW|nr:DNA-binding transcriptional regulator [Advenella kashmirensis]AFK63221.1 DNA-binding transcriptional activator MhpR [Advenella kashmirensis WT001]
MSSSQSVRSVARAIAILQAMNRQPVSTVDMLHLQTLLPKPTIVRLLRTLEDLHLVRHAPQHGAYYLTSEVRSLSTGYHSEPQIVEAAMSLMDAMTLKVKWPMAIAVFEDNAVVVRYSTIPLSPLALLHSSINMRLSLASRALGRAYLAFCDNEEQEIILDALALSSNAEDAPARDRVTFQELLRDIRSNGFATRSRTVRPVSQTIAVPILVQNRVVATVGLTFFSSVLTDKKAIATYLADLQELARNVSTRLQQLNHSAKDKAISDMNKGLKRQK